MWVARLLPRIALLALPILLGAAGDAPGDVVAQRGDVKITLGEVRDLLSHLDPALRAQLEGNSSALARFVRDRLMRLTLVNEAHAAKIDQTPDVLAKINEARDTIIMDAYLASKVPEDPNYPTEEQVQAAYEANKARFTTPKQYHIAQIAILVPAGASKEQDEAAHKKAAALRQDAIKPKADFADLARKNSQDKGSADKGGDMGWIPEDRLVPAVRDAVANLSDNGISQPVRSADAWHVVKLLGTRSGVLPLDQVRDTLVQAMRQNRMQVLARNYVENLLHQEPIQLNEIDLARKVGQQK
jgi:peptidylprolyl isomerase